MEDAQLKTCTLAVSIAETAFNNTETSTVALEVLSMAQSVIKIREELNHLSQLRRLSVGQPDKPPHS